RTQEAPGAHRSGRTGQLTLASGPAAREDRRASRRTPMSRISPYPLRRIAENELTHHVGGVDDADLDDLATSLVRQWLRNDGHAGLITPTHQHWSQMVARADGRLEVGRSTCAGTLNRILTRDWHVDEGRRQVQARLLAGPPGRGRRRPGAPRQAA